MSDISRRQLFRLRPKTIAKAFGEEEKSKDKRVHTGYIRPPGALSDPAEFNSKCTEGCTACATACPYESISFLGPEHGRAEGTPVIFPKDNPCRWCVDFPCISACLDGALIKNAEEMPASIALAEVIHSKCSNSYGELCDTCAITCPTSIRAVRIVERRVELSKDRCVGCGLCSYYCSEHNDAIVIKSLPLQKA